jgi:hypothetical protein
MPRHEAAYRVHLPLPVNGIEFSNLFHLRRHRLIAADS